MLVHAFLTWMDQAGAAERVEAVEMFAQAYLAGAMGAEPPHAVEAALTLVLDDPDINVRRALACLFADRADVPRHVALGLARDLPEVAALLIARSPLLTEADLVDLALTCRGIAAFAIGFRHEVTPRVAGALVSRGDLRLARLLVRNPGAEITEPDLACLVEAHGADPDLRGALLARAYLPASIRHRLLLAGLATTDGTSLRDDGLAEAGQARRIAEGLQQATLDIARQQPAELARYIAYLREAGHLTPGLLLLSLLGGDLTFLTAALADLVEMRPSRVAGLLRARSSAPIAALLAKAGLPAFLEAPLIEAVRAALAAGGPQADRALSLPIIRAAQSACLEIAGEEGVRLLALLRSYEAEAARAEARQIAGQLRGLAEPAPIALDATPTALALAGPVTTLIELDTDEAIIDLAEHAKLCVDGEPRDDAATAAAHPDIEIEAGRPLIAEEPTPDLRTLIAQWRAEAAARDAASPSQPADEDYRHWRLRLVA